ncbi:hypothetical protein [Streptomyces melanogenes]|uniref:Uncharacterized protein n=1 Tax=Streptomyces melanogenes TaxID=67326 RepID=A0ABZ1XU09_9ACTN|nr:hypothetical protein [Streptomyces melanogenes]
MGSKNRLMRWLGAAALIAGGSVCAVATPAEASTVEFTDSFEGNPWNRWEGFHEGDGVAGADLGQGLARTGANNGWLYTGQGWAAERIAVPVGSWGDRSNCTASIHAQPVGGGAQVGLQVWDPNGWHLLTETYPWLGGQGYQKITTGPINVSGLSTVYVQAIYGSSSGKPQFVRLDDVTFRCVS